MIQLPEERGFDGTRAFKGRKFRGYRVHPKRKPITEVEKAAFFRGRTVQTIRCNTARRGGRCGLPLIETVASTSGTFVVVAVSDPSGLGALFGTAPEDFHFWRLEDLPPRIMTECKRCKKTSWWDRADIT